MTGEGGKGAQSRDPVLILAASFVISTGSLDCALPTAFAHGNAPLGMTASFHADPLTARKSARFAS